MLIARSLFYLLYLALISSCSVSKKIERSSRQYVLNNEALKNAHVGIYIMDAATGKALYDYQGEKYFVPARAVEKCKSCCVSPDISINDSRG